MYVVTREDLPLGYQVPQAMHAAMEFANNYKEENKFWYATSNSLVVLSTKSERALWELSEKLTKLGLSHSKFFEPDVGYELTAIALVPWLETKKALSSLPLAGKRVSDQVDKVRCEALKRKFDVVDAMLGCLQTPQQNVLDHGLAVRDKLFEVRQQIITNTLPDTAPVWLKEHGSKLVKDLYDDFTLSKYTVWHDCGKPMVRTCDENGQHFPGHEQASTALFLELFPEETTVAELVRKDMTVHCLRHTDVEGVQQFCKNKRQAATLLLSGFAATESNCELFGGKDSANYKIKIKRLAKLGEAVCNTLYKSHTVT